MILNGPPEASTALALHRAVVGDLSVTPPISVSGSVIPTSYLWLYRHTPSSYNLECRGTTYQFPFLVSTQPSPASSLWPAPATSHCGLGNCAINTRKLMGVYSTTHPQHSDSSTLSHRVLRPARKQWRRPSLRTRWRRSHAKDRRGRDRMLRGTPRFIRNITGQATRPRNSMYPPVWPGDEQMDRRMGRQGCLLYVTIGLVVWRGDPEKEMWSNCSRWTRWM